MSRLGVRRSLAALALLVAWETDARAASDHVEIGVLTDLTGPYSAITGQGSVAAAQLAIEDAGPVLGHPVELVTADHLQKPDIGSAIAREWYDEGGVDAIFDGAGSSVALAILDIAKARDKVVAFSGVISPDVTGKLCGPTISSWAWDTHAMVATSLETVMRSGGKRIFFITTDSAVGRMLEDEATRIIVKAGGSVLGSVKHPLNTPDFSSFLLQAQAAQPDVIVLANAGNDTVNAIKQAGEFGLTKGAKPIVVAGLLALLNDINALGLESSQGVVVAESFYWNTDDATRAWNKRFQARTGTAANMLQAGVYSAVLHYLKSVQAAGTQDSKTVAARMKATPINDMYSHDVTLRADGRAVRDFFLFKVKAPSESRQPWDDYNLLSRLPGTEAFPSEASACPLIH